MIKFTLAFICVLFYSNLSSQIGFEFKMDRPEVDDVFGAAVCDSIGNLYVGYGYKLQNTNLPSGVAWIYKIDLDGDTLQFNYQKQDTTLFLLKPIIDNEEYLLLMGEGYRIDSIGNFSGKFQIFIKMTTSFEILWKRYYHLESISEVVWTGLLAETSRNSYVYATIIEDITTGNFRMSSFELSKEGDSLDYFQHDPELLGLLYSITTNPIDSTILEYHLTIPVTGNNSSCGRLQLGDSFQYISLEPYTELHFQNPFSTMNFRDQTYLSGGRFGFGSDYIQVRIMDSTLNVLKSVNLCYNEDETVPAWIKCIDYHNPDRIFVVGTSPYFSDYEPNYIYVACLDSGLAIIHEEYIGGDGHYDVFYMVATPDGGVAISGSYIDVSAEPLQKDGYLVKLDSSMFVGLPDYKMTEKEMLIEVFPSPAHGQVTISSNIANYYIKLLDLTGKVIMEHQIRDKAENIDISHLLPGLYLLNAKFGQFSNTQKLLIY